MVKKLLAVGIILLLVGMGIPSTGRIMVENVLPTELIIDGPPIGMLGKPYYCTILLTCEEECDFFFTLDWGDETSTGWLGPYPCSEEITLAHSYQKCGKYTIGAIAMDCNGSDYFATVNVTIIDNHFPEAPWIAGPVHGKVGVDYDFTFCSTDPDGDNVSYLVKWGDGHITDWIGPFPSGNEIILNHTWDDIRYYLIECKAKDIYGAESDWGEIRVTIPKSYNPIWWLNNLLDRFPLLQRLLGWFLW